MFDLFFLSSLSNAIDLYYFAASLPKNVSPRSFNSLFKLGFSPGVLAMLKFMIFLEATKVARFCQHIHKCEDACLFSLFGLTHS